MRVSKIKYNPKLSIKENATKNNCSEAGIRYFIRVNQIDRENDRVSDRLTKYRLAYKEGDTPYSLQKQVGGSLNTIKRYWKYITSELEPSIFDRNKKHKLTVRQARDYYATHPSVVKDLLQYESFNHNILEPCCGGGFMSEAIKSMGYDVFATDIVYRGYGDDCGDFLTMDFPVGKYDIITNPPYNDIPSFVKRALSICKEKVAFLMPLRYLSSLERLSLYQTMPPKTIYVYSNRITIAKNGEFEKYKSGMNLNIFAWYVWHKDYVGITSLRWLVNKEQDE